MRTATKVLIYDRAGNLMDEINSSDPDFCPGEEMQYNGAQMERGVRKEYEVAGTKVKVFSYYPKRERRAAQPFVER